MKIELNSNLIPIFSGTYNSIWQIDEYDNFDTEIEYDHADFMYSIVEAYKSAEYQIIGLFKEIDFITDFRVSGTFDSPREYNFRTDVIDFTLTINSMKLINKLMDLKTDKKFHKFLKDEYSSYDGFISFTPDNYNELKNSILNGYNSSSYEQSISALINYLASYLYSNIEFEAYETWSCNGYMGLDYTIEEY